MRDAEADRKAYAEETVAIIKKQRTRLEFLRRENTALKENLTQGLDKQYFGGDRSRTPTAVQRVSSAKHSLSRPESFKNGDGLRKSIQDEEKKLKKIMNNIKIFEKQISILIFLILYLIL